MPRNTTESARARRSAGTSPTVSPAISAVAAEPAPISTRAASSVGRSGAIAVSALPSVKTANTEASAPRRDIRPVSVSTTGASTAVAMA
jgi:hypothetical protein